MGDHLCGPKSTLPEVISSDSRAACGDNSCGNVAAEHGTETHCEIEHEEDEERDDARMKSEARQIAARITPKLYERSEISDIEYIAKGGYNFVWKVTYAMV